MKIAFFLDNEGISGVDCSQSVEGNPGIGGTEWLILVVATLLSRRDNGLSVTLYATNPGLFPDDLTCVTVRDIKDALTKASHEGVVNIVMKHLAQNVVEDVLSDIPQGLDVTIWSHIFMSYWELDYYADKKSVKDIIFVGRETADLYRDHRAFSKINYIYNCVNLSELPNEAAKVPFGTRAHVVTYMGSLVPFKGFHLLAQAWPSIIKAVPDAELYVIGNGKLYDKDAQLGRWGLAEKEYEDAFMAPLTLDDGNLLPSVHFMGRMGTEKKEILLKTKVAVPNPSGITETFCLCAVEMQAAGAAVTTINYPGFIDTVKNGRLYSKRKDLADSVIKLLLAKDDRFDDAVRFFEEEFSYDKVVSRWEALFNDNLRKETALLNSNYRLKWLKEARGKLSARLPFLYKLPITERILLFLERLVNGRITYLDS